MKQVSIALVVLLSTGCAWGQRPAGHPVAAIPVVRHWQLFTDPNEGAFQLEMPQGWKLSGGTARRSALQYRAWASATSPDGSTMLIINDPEEQNYITPSPMLAATGFRAGSLYNAGAGNTYLVAPYKSGVQFAVSWGQRRLNNYCTSIKLTNSRSRPELSKTINGLARGAGITYDYGEAAFSCQRNGVAMTASVLVRTLLAGVGGPQGGIWLADAIEAFVAPAPVAGVAAGLLAHMIKTNRTNQAWAARQSQTTMEVARINAQANIAISDSIMSGWEQRGATMDRVMEQGSRARLGIDIYSDPVTGIEYTVGNSNRYYWTNAGGDVVGTDTIDPPGPAFRRLNRVPPQ